MRRNNLKALGSPILYKLPKCNVVQFQSDSFSKHILGFFGNSNESSNLFHCS